MSHRPGPTLTGGHRFIGTVLIACSSETMTEDIGWKTMAILSDRSIEQALAEGRISVEPLFRPLQPASIDLRMGETYLRPVSGSMQIVDRYGEKPAGGKFEEIRFNIVRDFAILPPREFVLVSTYEWIEIGPDLTGILTGKSSLARDGLQVEAAGYVDPGWKGRLTLELVNLGPFYIMLRPQMPIAQIRFETIDNPVNHLYGDRLLRSHYQQADGPQPGYDPGAAWDSEQ